MSENRIKKNIGISLLIKPLSMVLSMVYIPIILNYLGEEKYGIWTVMLSIISWINYFDIGIGKGLRNNLTVAMANDNKKDANTIVSTAYLITIVISSIFFILFSLISIFFNIPKMFNLQANDENTLIVLIVSIAFICINFILALAKEITYSIHKTSIVSLQALAIQILNVIVALVIGYFSKSNLLFVAIMYGFSTMICNIFLQIYIFRKHRFLKPKWSNFDKIILKSMTVFGLLLFVQNICSLVLNTTDSLIISSFFGAKHVTPYNIVFNVYNIIMSFFYIIITPMWSEYTEAAFKKNYVWIKKSIKRINFIILFFSIICIFLVFTFKPLAFLWLKRELEYPKYLIFFMCLYTIFNMIANNYNCVLQGIGKIKYVSLLSGFEAIMNIPLSIFLSVNLKMGISGILLSSVFMLAISSIVCPMLVYHYLSISKK